MRNAACKWFLFQNHPQAASSYEFGKPKPPLGCQFREQLIASGDFFFQPGRRLLQRPARLLQSIATISYPPPQLLW